jgi:hypothetical protein
MTHPFGNIRQHDVERSRVSSMCKGYASGGAVQSFAVPGAQLAKKAPKPAALKIAGGAPAVRMDRPSRAKGGRVKKGATNVNVIIAPQGAPSSPSAAGVGLAPPKPPMPPPPPMAGPPPGAGMPPPGPPGMPMRSNGGRAYATGGGVKDHAATAKYMSHAPGKNDGKNVGRGKPVTFKTGGAVFSSSTGQHGPKFDGGGGGGTARLQKESRAARNYKKVP